MYKLDRNHDEWGSGDPSINHGPQIQRKEKQQLHAFGINCGAINFMLP